MKYSSMNSHLTIRNKSIILLIIVVVITIINMEIFRYKSHRIKEEKLNKEEKDSLSYDDIFGEDITLSSSPQLKLPNHNQEDLKLVNNLFSKLIPPSPKSVPYSLQLPAFDSSQGQGRVVRRLTNYKEGGFFVECGAGDGEHNSNTLSLEKYLDWTGLLVEAHPDVIDDLKRVHRRAWIAPVCMGVNTSAYNAYFDVSSYYSGKIVDSNEETRPTMKVTCYPFYTFLLALNITTVDYFSIHVQGHEVEILETIPFDKVNISVISIRFSNARGGLLGVKGAMEQKGYRLVKEIPPDDLVFIKSRPNDFSYQQMLTL